MVHSAEDLLSALTGKQRFIPERNLLLQYADPNFIERSPASNRFMRFFCDKMSCSERIAAIAPKPIRGIRLNMLDQHRKHLVNICFDAILGIENRHEFILPDESCQKYKYKGVFWENQECAR